MQTDIAMKLRIALLAAALAVTSAPAFAEPVKGFYFRVERNQPKVEGIYSVGGYSYKDMHVMMAKYCKSGKITQFANVGKQRKRRGQVLQKFQAVCAACMPDRFKGSFVGIEIEYITKGEYSGKHLVEITGSDGAGNMVYLRETTTP